MEQLTADTTGDGAPTTETESPDPFTQAKREYRELQEENERLQARIRELETENENLQARAEAAEANADEHASRREEAETKLAQAQKAHDMAQQKIDALEEEAGPEGSPEAERKLQQVKNIVGLGHDHGSDPVEAVKTLQELVDEYCLVEPDKLEALSEKLERRTGSSILDGHDVDFNAFDQVIEEVDEIAEERNRMKGQLETIQSALS
jgi:chromosome segregation ATPase